MSNPLGDWVVMTNPTLPDQPIRVASEAVPVHELSGWKVDPDIKLDSISPEEFIERFGYDPR